MKERKRKQKGKICDQGKELFIFIFLFVFLRAFQKYNNSIQ